MALDVGAILGTRLRARREARGWSQAHLAEVVDLTPNYLGTLERGEALPTVQTLIALADALGAQPAELLGDLQHKAEWIDELIAIAVTVPASARPLLIALAREVAAHARSMERLARRRASTR
jgi:transcriptional regulator with XRE-family HTH domain